MEMFPRTRSRSIAASPAVAPPLVAVLIVMLTAVALIPTASANVLTIGGKRNRWASNVNYTEWATSQRFFLGDWLVFRWQKGSYDIVQVNAMDYASCLVVHPITNWSRSDRWAIELNETGPWYFICSRGLYWSSMKVTVNIEPLPNVTVPALLVPHNTAATAFRSFASFATAVLIGALGFGV